MVKSTRIFQPDSSGAAPVARKIISDMVQIPLIASWQLGLIYPSKSMEVLNCAIKITSKKVELPFDEVENGAHWRSALAGGPLGSTQDLPPGDKQAYTASAVTPRFAQTFLDEGMGMSEGEAQARAVTTLGALPLIVLSRGKDQDADWAASQAGYLQLSTDSQQLFADQSGHRIMIDQPEAAVAAIVTMVKQLR